MGEDQTNIENDKSDETLEDLNPENADDVLGGAVVNDPDDDPNAP